MCEILLLVGLCRSIGDLLRRKGRDPVGFQVLAVVLWIGCEISGALLAVALIAAGGGANESSAQGAALVGAIGGAICGATMGYAIAASAAPRRRSPGSVPGATASGGNAPLILPPELGGPAAGSPFSPGPGAGTPTAAATFQFYCPNGHLLQDQIAAAGQQRTCPSCQVVFVVPRRL